MFFPRAGIHSFLDLTRFYCFVSLTFKRVMFRKRRVHTLRGLTHSYPLRILWIHSLHVRSMSHQHSVLQWKGETDWISSFFNIISGAGVCVCWATSYQFRESKYLPQSAHKTCPSSSPWLSLVPITGQCYFWGFFSPGAISDLPAAGHMGQLSVWRHSIIETSAIYFKQSPLQLPLGGVAKAACSRKWWF